MIKKQQLTKTQFHQAVNVVWWHSRHQERITCCTRIKRTMLITPASFFRAGVVCVVRYLLSACPESVNDLDYGSRTPLHYAAAQGWVEVATHLLQNGAEVDYR